MERDSILMEELTLPFVNTCASVLSDTTGIPFSYENLNEKAENQQFAGVIGFSGDLNGLLIITSEDDNLILITEKITGMNKEDIEFEDLCDCIGELANMICGTTRSKLALKQINLSLSTPFSVSGEKNIHFTYKQRASRKTFNVYCEELQFILEIIFF
ncbi:MAG: chemotaxis protein CheX [Anaerotignaceae bacterium]